MKRSMMRCCSARPALALLAAAVVAAGAGCSGPKFQRVPAAEVNATQRAFAEKWANQTLANWMKGEYPQVGQEATRDFRGSHNVAKRQKDAYAFVKSKVGGFKSMTFHEAQRSLPHKHVVYRFHGDFERGEAEVRVVLDLEGKIDGFFIKPWRDELR